VVPAVPVLGLDALASASYGPEAALTVLIPLGAGALGFIGPITAAIAVVLLLVAISYGQTIPAYPNGGGSFTVAKENLGENAGLLAATALCIDYVLNTAVAISAGVGAVASIEPRLLPWTLPLCLGVLVALTVVNLRGVREAGLVFVAPTYLFVGCLLATVAIGAWKTFAAHGHPHPVAAPPQLSAAAEPAGLWIVARAFASGCTALTGVEAVSNAVPIFRKPKVRNARRTLAAIAGILMVLIAGIAFLAHAYGIGATEPGRPGYQSVISQLVAAVAGRGAFYYLTMGSVFAVLALSANTSFADFPRVCRLLALDDYLPDGFARRGRRLVYSRGIVTLAVLAAVLLVAFRGITDRLIPLFAVGAFLSFSMSQLGMVLHWKRQGNSRSLLLNLFGAVATLATLIVIVVSKFAEGAWLTVLVIPAVLLAFWRVRRAAQRVSAERVDSAPLDLSALARPIVVVPAQRLDRVARKGLRMALTLSDDVRVVQVIGEETKADDLTGSWEAQVADPARKAGLPTPKLVVISSAYRQFFGPLLDYLRRLSAAEPERPIAVLVPELVRRRWYHFFVRSRATLLKALLLFEGGPQITIINTPWYLSDELEGAVISRPHPRWRPRTV
ncbi:MAG TPA: APC family permease, partial [Myxococcales bacterium]|nr:APC family permease [Myxococcales bacterium]